MKAAKKPPPQPKPQPSYSLGGFLPSGRYRIRMGWFLYPIVEELYYYSDGSKRWKRCGWMETIEIGRAPMEGEP